MSHILTDADEGRKSLVGHLLGWALGFLFLAGIEKSNPHQNTHILHAISLCAGAVILCCIPLIALVVYRATFRNAIRHHLINERKFWDPNEKNLRVFVSKRDRDTTTRRLFDEITRFCYRHNISIVQYADFDWPLYSETRTRVQGAPTVEKHPNANSVAQAMALLWIDFGRPSEAMRLEMREAEKLNLPIVRVGRIKGSRNFAVGTSRTCAEFSQVPPIVAAVLSELIVSNIAEKSCAKASTPAAGSTSSG